MKPFQLKKSEPTLESLRLGALEVSVEAAGLNPLVGVNASVESLSIHRPNLQLLRKLDDLVDDLSSFVTRKLNGMRGIQKGVDLDRLFKLINRDDYLTLAPSEVPVPEGMSVPWLEYLSVIKHANGIAMRLHDDTLRPFSLFVGQAINDPAKMSNSTFQHNAVIHDLGDVTKELVRIKSAGKRTEARYDAVVGRNADWQAVETAINEILEARKAIPQERIRALVLSLDDQIKQLIKRMGNTTLQYRPSPEVITQLADLCHALAEQVSYYAVVTTLVVEAKEALDATAEHLKRA